MALTDGLKSRIRNFTKTSPESTELIDLLDALCEVLDAITTGAGTPDDLVVFAPLPDGLQSASVNGIGRITGNNAQLQVGNLSAELVVGRVLRNGSPFNGISNANVSGFTAYMPGKAFPQIIMGDASTTGTCFLDVNGTTPALRIGTLVTSDVVICDAAGTLGFYDKPTGVAQPTVTGSASGDAFRTSLMAALGPTGLNLVADGTT